MSKAEDAVKEEKDKGNGEDPYDPTLAIVLGVLGGLVGVALIVGAGFMFYKKKNKKVK